MAVFSFLFIFFSFHNESVLAPANYDAMSKLPVDGASPAAAAAGAARATSSSDPALRKIFFRIGHRADTVIFPLDVSPSDTVTQIKQRIQLR